MAPPPLTSSVVVELTSTGLADRDLGCARVFLPCFGAAVAKDLRAEAAARAGERGAGVLTSAALLVSGSVGGKMTRVGCGGAGKLVD